MFRPWRAIRSVAAAVACLAIAGLVANPGTSFGDGPKPLLPVVVTNVPLPVTAAQAGAWSVSVVNRPAVDVATLPSVTIDTSKALPVRDVDNAARHPFQAGIDSFLLGEDQEIPGPEIPAGKVFVVEYVSGTVGLPVGERLLSLGLRTSQGAVSIQDHILAPPALAVSTASYDAFSYGQVTRLYCTDQGITVVVHRPVGAGTGALKMTFSGYLLDMTP